MEDLKRAAEEIPKWVPALIGPLNEFMETVVGALRGGLTFSDNFSGKTLEIEFTHGVPKQVNPQLQNRRVVGMLVLSSGAQLVDSSGFVQQAGLSSNLSITINFKDGISTTKATCRIFLLAE